MKGLQSYVSKQKKLTLPIRIRVKFKNPSRRQKWKELANYALRDEKLVHIFKGKEYPYDIARVTGYGSGDNSKPHHSVYVVKLVGVPEGTGRDVYVGMTGKSIEDRIRDHKVGKKAGRKYVTKYGTELLPELYRHLNPMTWEDAVAMERDLAEQLRAKGYNVYGGH